MPQAIVDPAELRRFIQHLKKFNGEMLEQMQGASGNWSRWAPRGAIRSTNGSSKNLNNNCAPCHGLSISPINMFPICCGKRNGSKSICSSAESFAPRHSSFSPSR